MPQVKREQTRQDDKYLREIAAQYLTLTIEDLAVVLTHPVTEGDAMRAAHLVPELMERVYDAIDAMPSPLTQEEEAEAIQSGANIAVRLLAKASKAAPTPFEGACECLAQLLQKPMKAVEAMCLGWSEPSLQTAMAAGGDIELKAKLSRGSGGQVHLQVNSYGTGKLRGQFDRPTSVSVVLFDQARNDVIPIMIGAASRRVVTIKARTTTNGLISFPIPRKQDLMLVVLASLEENA